MSTTLTATRAIARFAADFDAGRLSAYHLRECGRAFADTYAVAVAGLREPAAKRALEYVRTMSPVGPARLWGLPYGAAVEGAALFNGIAAHALDYDDASSPMGGHPSVVLLPALLALGEARNRNGMDVATAYAVGFEVACKLGRALSQEHYARGWHLTATIGTVACAAACSQLLGLDEQSICNAIGLAIAQTGGSRANFGSDTKAFQAGQAGAAGIRAALLAQTGFTAAPDAIDGPAGFTELYSKGESLFEALQYLGDSSLELETSGIEIKKYPACYVLHRPLDGLIDLIRKHGLTPDNVTRIDVEVSHGALAPLLTRLPATGHEGRFSMAYVLAAALFDGDIRLSSFTDTAAARPQLRPLMKNVVSSEASGLMVPRWAMLRVALADGRILTQRIDALRGSPQLPLTDAQLFDKLRDCYAWADSPGDPSVLMQAAVDLPKLSVRSLLDRLDNAADPCQLIPTEKP